MGAASRDNFTSPEVKLTARREEPETLRLRGAGLTCRVCEVPNERPEWIFNGTCTEVNELEIADGNMRQALPANL